MLFQWFIGRWRTAANKPLADRLSAYEYFHAGFRPEFAKRWKTDNILAYWGDVYPINGTVVLTGPGAEGRTSWMSMTPSEIES